MNKEEEKAENLLFEEISKLEKYPAFKKLFEKNDKEIIDIFIDVMLGRHLIKENFPIEWLVKNSREVKIIDSYNGNIWEPACKIGIKKIKQVKKIICLIRMNENKIDDDLLGFIGGDMHEDFPFTKESNISYTIIYHKDKFKQPKNKKDFRQTCLVAW